MDRNTTLSDAFDAFLAHCIRKGLSKESLRGYRSWCAPFIRQYGDHVVGDMTTEDMQDFVMWVMDRTMKKEISQNTAASYVRNMKIFMKFISDEMNGDVSFQTEKISQLKAPKKDVQMYTKEQISQLLQAAEQSEDWMTNRNRAIIALVLDSGVRREEIIKITISDYLSCKSIGAIKIEGKGFKDRYVPIGDQTQHLIDAYIEECPYPIRSSLFIGHRGNPLTKSGLSKIMEVIASKVPFEFSLHRLRHHFATEYLLYSYEESNSMDAYGLRTLLGHSSFSTTDRYIHSATSINAAKSHKPLMDRMDKDNKP